MFLEEDTDTGKEFDCQVSLCFWPDREDTATPGARISLDTGASPIMVFSCNPIRFPQFSRPKVLVSTSWNFSPAKLLIYTVNHANRFSIYSIVYL